VILPDPNPEPVDEELLTRDYTFGASTTCGQEGLKSAHIDASGHRLSSAVAGA
jgi:hypothetical protein